MSIENVEVWFLHRAMRNICALTYDHEKAGVVHEGAGTLLDDARALSLPWKHAMDEVPLIDVPPKLWAVVRDILRGQAPGYEVWAFGSRVTGKAKRYSDLDLAIIGNTALPLTVRAGLEDAFSASDLRWRVDVLDWATTGATFRAIIMHDKVVVQRANSAAAAG